MALSKFLLIAGAWPYLIVCVDVAVSAECLPHTCMVCVSPGARGIYSAIRNSFALANPRWQSLDRRSLVIARRGSLIS